MKTVFLGQNPDFDVVYDIVTQVRKIEDGYSVDDNRPFTALRIDGKRLLSDALFHYKNSQAARNLSAKQVSVQFVQDIKSHLAQLNLQTSANDTRVEHYKNELNEYLQHLSIIQSQLVDIPEWPDLRDKFKNRMITIDPKKYPSVNILTSFIDSMDRANTSQAEKIHKTIDMMTKCYLSLIKQHKVENKEFASIENTLSLALMNFLVDDLNINIDELKPNEKIIHLIMRDPKTAEAFQRAYGHLKISIA